MADLVDRLNAALEGRYRIEREIGSGGMATVYLATTSDTRWPARTTLRVAAQGSTIMVLLSKAAHRAHTTHSH